MRGVPLEPSGKEKWAELVMLTTERGGADQAVVAEMSVRPEINIIWTIVGPSRSRKRLGVPWVSRKRGVLKVAEPEVTLG